MTDDPTIPEPDEPRVDARVRDLLAVAPLDEVTRRRLVDRALEAAPGAPERHRGRSRLALAIPVAAAIALGLVIGTVVVTRPEDTTTTAAPSSAPAPPGDGERAGSTDEPALAPAETSLLADLGDLGPILDSDDLAATAIVARDQQRAGDAASTRTLPCTQPPPADLGFVAVDAAGSATIDSAPVTILIGRDADGGSSAIAVAVDTCAPVLRATLGSTLPDP